jgi:hypothetical protein
VAQPIPYDPSASFIFYDAGLPGFPGQQLDIEFSNLQTTLDEILANLALIQRDDTHIANGSIDFAQLTDAVRAALGIGGGTGDTTVSVVVSGSSFTVPVGAQRVLVNKITGSATVIQLPIAASMLSTVFLTGVLIADIKGDAATHNITITFTDGELCGGSASIVISTKYGRVALAPIPGGGGWYRS